MDDMERFLKALDELPDDVMSKKFDSDNGKKGGARPSKRKKRKGYDLTVDLHGLTEAEALERVRKIIVDAQGGRKKILVITGRGNNSEGSIPVIREGVRQFLTGAGRKYIEDFTYARGKDGGDGAIEIVTR